MGRNNRNKRETVLWGFATILIAGCNWVALLRLHKSIIIADNRDCNRDCNRDSESSCGLVGAVVNAPDAPPPPLPFLLGDVCRRCRHFVPTIGVDVAKRRCGSYITADQPESPLSSSSSTTTIVPQACQDVCWQDSCDRRLYRYDSVLVDAVQPIGVEERSYWMSTSVPERHRLPVAVAAANNITQFFQQDNARVFPRAEYWFDYNPSIVRLSVDLAHRLLGVSFTHDDGNGGGQYYLASFRVSNQQSCLPPEDRKRMMGIINDRAPPTVVRPTAKDYLGLAVLDAQFQVLIDATVDIAAIAGFAGAQDFRLFALRGKTYIATNDLIAELALTTVHDNEVIPNAQRVPAAFANVPASVSFSVWMGQHPACAPCTNSRVTQPCGKNFNYFATDQEEVIMTEIWPSGPHTVRPIDLQTPCRRNVVGPTYVDDTPPPNQIISSYSTTEEIDFPQLERHENIFTSRGRGGACCVPIVHEGQTVLLGIQHRKTPSQRNARLPEGLADNHYVSSFYAFTATAPFRQIAESGHFCLGFGTAELNQLTRFRKLTIGRTFDCPRIHFVSGMLMDEVDNSIIVAYGINDCVSRFVRIPLDTVRRLLFSGP